VEGIFASGGRGWEELNRSIVRQLPTSPQVHPTLPRSNPTSCQVFWERRTTHPLSLPGSKPCLTLDPCLPGTSPVTFLHRAQLCKPGTDETAHLVPGSTATHRQTASIRPPWEKRSVPNLDVGSYWSGGSKGVKGGGETQASCRWEGLIRAIRYVGARETRLPFGTSSGILVIMSSDRRATSRCPPLVPPLCYSLPA